MPSNHLARFAAALFLVAGALSAAKAQLALGEMRRQVTRAELETTLASYEKLAVSTGDKRIRKSTRRLRPPLFASVFAPGTFIPATASSCES